MTNENNLRYIVNYKIWQYLYNRLHINRFYSDTCLEVINSSAFDKNKDCIVIRWNLVNAKAIKRILKEELNLQYKTSEIYMERGEYGPRIKIPVMLFEASEEKLKELQAFFTLLESAGY